MNFIKAITCIFKRHKAVIYMCQKNNFRNQMFQTATYVSIIAICVVMTGANLYQLKRSSVKAKRRQVFI
jgi:hypothetical protein